MKKSNFLESMSPSNIVLELNSPPIFQQRAFGWEARCLEDSNDYDLFVVFGGQALFSLDFKTFIVEEGQALLVKPEQIIYIRNEKKTPLKMVAQHFNIKFFNHIDLFSYVNFNPKITFDDWSYIEKNIYKMRDDFSYIRHSAFYAILTSFLNHSFMADKKVQKSSTELVLKMISYINNNIVENNLLEQVIALSTFGYSHTANLFKKITGLSPKVYITKHRLKLAKEALFKKKAVKEAARIAGYDDELYFSRIFKRYEGVSPSNYLKNL